MNNIYLYKTIIELVILVAAYFVASGMDKRITVLEQKEEHPLYFIDDSRPLCQKHHNHEKFSDKIKSEEKRMKNSTHIGGKSKIKNK